MESILFFVLLVLGWIAFSIMNEYKGKKVVNVLCGIGSFVAVSFATYIYIVNWCNDYVELQAPTPIFSIVFDTVVAGVTAGIVICGIVFLISSIVYYLIDEKKDRLIGTIMYIVIIMCILRSL